MAYSNPDRQRRYSRYWMRLRRKQWFAANGPCKQCGSWEDLELDHIDPADKVHHVVWSWSEERRTAELAKCQALCHTCHKAKTVAALSKPLVHGTDNGYRKRRCRCAECRLGNATRKRERDARNMAKWALRSRTSSTLPEQSILPMSANSFDTKCAVGESNTQPND